MPPALRPLTLNPAKSPGVVRQARKVAGAGIRAQAPVPFLHRHPANRASVEVLGRLPAPPPH
jgi:hypothetical protein